MSDSKNIYDVIIVGSGPAGSSAAYHLAKNGLRVLTIEKEKHPRYKTCGGGIIRKSITFLPFDISEVIEKECFKAEVYDYQANLKFLTKRKYPSINMTMRTNLDNLLLSETKKIGTEVLENCTANDLIFKNNSITLITSKGIFFTNFLIAADGVNSLIAKKSGWNETRKIIPALEYEVYLTENKLKNLLNTTRFDFGVIPDGYGWVFPKKDHLSIGILSMRKLKQFNLNDEIKKYLEILEIKEFLKIEKHGYSIPVHPRRDTFAKNNVLLTGDAAGFADPVTAEGISFSILSGQLAAKSIIEALPDPQKVMDIYNLEISKTILPELHSARIISNLIYKFPSVRILLFKMYGQKLSEIMTDIIMGERTYKKMINNPFNYLKLLKFWNYKKQNLHLELE